MTGPVVLLAAVAVALVVALLHRRYDGRLRARRTTEDLRALLPEPAGQRATLLQFSSAFCAPCRATSRVLKDVAGVVPGVAHVDLDAESHLDLVRHLRVVKTPTTLVLDSRGREVLRATGQPSKPAVLAALGQAVPS